MCMFVTAADVWFGTRIAARYLLVLIRQALVVGFTWKELLVRNDCPECPGLSGVVRGCPKCPIGAQNESLLQLYRQQFDHLRFVRRRRWLNLGSCAEGAG